MKVIITHNMANYKFIVLLKDGKNRTKSKSFVYARGSNRSQGVAKKKALEYMTTLKNTIRNNPNTRNQTGRTGVSYNKAMDKFSASWTYYYINNDNQIVKKREIVLLPTLNEAISVREYIEENVLYNNDQLKLKQKYSGKDTEHNQNPGNVFPWKEYCDYTICRTNNTSGKTGVFFNKKIKKWAASWHQIFCKNDTLIKKQVLKHFDTFEEALKKRIWVEENILYTLEHLKLKTDYMNQKYEKTKNKTERKHLEKTL